MPRYFFDIHKDGNKLLHDEEGSDLASDRVAETEAIGILQDMTRSMAFGDDDQDTIHAHVRNEVGDVIFKANLALTTERIQIT